MFRRSFEAFSKVFILDTAFRYKSTHNAIKNGPSHDRKSQKKYLVLKMWPGHTFGTLWACLGIPRGTQGCPIGLTRLFLLRFLKYKVLFTSLMKIKYFLTRLTHWACPVGTRAFPGTQGYLGTQGCPIGLTILFLLWFIKYQVLFTSFTKIKYFLIKLPHWACLVGAWACPVGTLACAGTEGYLGTYVG